MCQNVVVGISWYHDLGMQSQSFHYYSLAWSLKNNLLKRNWNMLSKTIFFKVSYNTIQLKFFSFLTISHWKFLPYITFFIKYIRMKIPLKYISNFYMFTVYILYTLVSGTYFLCKKRNIYVNSNIIIAKLNHASKNQPIESSRFSVRFFPKFAEPPTPSPTLLYNMIKRQWVAHNWKFVSRSGLV